MQVDDGVRPLIHPHPVTSLSFISLSSCMWESVDAGEPRQITFFHRSIFFLSSAYIYESFVRCLIQDTRGVTQCHYHYLYLYLVRGSNIHIYIQIKLNEALGYPSASGNNRKHWGKIKTCCNISVLCEFWR